MPFPTGFRKASGGGHYCVPNCESVKNLFGDSEYVNERAEWLWILKVKDEEKELLVCSLHFVKDDYSFPGN